MAPRHDVAHLGHVELLTPEPERSLWFFTELMGLTENGRDGDSVFLRTWDDYEQYSLVLTASETSGIRRTALRTSSQDALDRLAATIPDGHEIQLYWETTWFEAPPELSPSLKNQPQAYPGRGIGVRRLDHVNFLASDVPANTRFVADALGGEVTEQIVLDDGSVAASWLHFGNKSYDLVHTNDWTGSSGRLHHIAFATDTREDILRGADIFLDNGVFIETGPHKHAIQQTFFLYVYEPGGNRIELCNSTARLVLAPDWRTITWTEAERAKGQAWGLRTIESFHTHGTPPVHEGPVP